MGSSRQRDAARSDSAVTLAAVLASGAPVTAIAPRLVAAMPLNVVNALGGQAAALAAARRVVQAVSSLPAPPTPTGRITRRARSREFGYRALYALNALRRLSKATDTRAALRRERGYLQRHYRANRHRMEKARQVEEATARHGPLLGWYAVLDNNTTPDCRAAHGKNFDPLDPPRRGLPGTLHGSCRCVAGPPVPGAEKLR